MRILLVALLFLSPAYAQAPKHVNKLVTIEGDHAIVQLDFWKHLIDTMNQQETQIRELKYTIFVMERENIARQPCR